MKAKEKTEAIAVYKKSLAYWQDKLKLAQKEVATCKSEIAHAKEMIKVWKAK